MPWPWEIDSPGAFLGMTGMLSVCTEKLIIGPLPLNMWYKRGRKSVCRTGLEAPNLNDFYRFLLF